MNDELAAELLWVLIEGPGPGDAEFLGRWLLAAVEADQTLEEQFKRNTALKDQISRVEIVYHVRFSSGATRFIELLMRNLYPSVTNGPSFLRSWRGSGSSV